MKALVLIGAIFVLAFSNLTLHAEMPECVIRGYRIQTSEYGSLVIGTDAHGRFELIRCEELQVGARRFAVILATVQLPDVENIQSRDGGWRTRIKLSPDAWMWLESQYGWLCDGRTKYACSMSVYAADLPDPMGAIFELHLHTPKPSIRSARFEWLTLPKLLEIF